MGLKLQRANINLVENRLILAPEWGSITGDITEQEDLNLILTSVNSELETLDNSLNTTNTNLANLEQTTEGINNRLSGVEQTYATKSEVNQLSTDLENLTDSALTEQDADNKYALKNGSNSEEFKAQSLYIAPYSILVEGGELSFFHNGSRTNIHLPEDMGSGTVALTKNYYDKTEIDNKLSNLDLSIFEIVNELPTTNINENKIYLVRNDQTTGSNLYTEYRYTNNSWEILGEYKSDVDLADYYTKSEVEDYVSDNIVSPHAFSKVFNSCYTTEWLDSPFTPTDMENLAKKSEVYSKSEIDALVSGGGSDLFIVTITYLANYTYSFDKTYAEILEAYNSGKTIIAKIIYSQTGAVAYTSLVMYLPSLSRFYFYRIEENFSYSVIINSSNETSGTTKLLVDKNTTELVNYYTKSNTYSKSEIDTKIGDIESILATL